MCCITARKLKNSTFLARVAVLDSLDKCCVIKKLVIFDIKYAMSRNALQNPVMREQIEYGKYYVTKWLHNLAFARNERRMK